MCPIMENSNTVTVGSICYSCGEFQAATCPYGNHRRIGGAITFQGDIRGKCTYYQPVVEAEGNKNMKKLASKDLTDSQLNIALYRKIMAMSEPDRNEFVAYWSYLFPQDYAEDMADDETKTEQKDIQQGNIVTKTEDNKDQLKAVDKKEKNEKVKFWYKNQKA